MALDVQLAEEILLTEFLTDSNYAVTDPIE